jgi:osmotically inducible protein OsmC
MPRAERTASGSRTGRWPGAAGPSWITGVVLSARGRVGGLDEPSFRDAVDRASALCPVSDALRGNVDVTVEAALDAA